MEQQSEKAKRLAKNTLVLYLRMIFTVVLHLYTARVVLQSLGVVDFGLYNAIGGIVGFMSFLNSSLSVTTIRFITFSQGKESTLSYIRSVFCTSKIVHYGLALLIFVAAETIGLWFINNKLIIPHERLDSILVVYQFTVITCLISIISVPYNALIIAHEKMSAFAFISIYEAIANLFAAMAVSFVNVDKLIAYGLLLMLVQVSVRVMYGVYCFKNFQETRGKYIVDKTLMKQMFSFAFWISNGTLAMAAYTQGLNLLLNMFFGPVVNAARGIAVQVQQRVYNFCASFQTAVKPQITKSYASGDFSYLHKLVINTSNLSFFLVFVLTLPLMLETPFVLKVWLGMVPDFSVVFVRLTLILGLMQSLITPMNTSIHATGNVKKFQLFEGTALLMIVPVAYFFLRQGFSPVSVFIVQIVFFGIAQVMRCIIVCPAISMKKSLYMKNCLGRIVLTIAAPSLIMYAFFSYVPFQAGWTRLVLVCLISTIFSCFSIYHVGLDADMKKKVLSMILKKLHFSK